AAADLERHRIDDAARGLRAAVPAERQHAHERGHAAKRLHDAAHLQWQSIVHLVSPRPRRPAPGTQKRPPPRLVRGGLRVPAAEEDLTHVSGLAKGALIPRTRASTPAASRVRNAIPRGTPLCMPAPFVVISDDTRAPRTLSNDAGACCARSTTRPAYGTRSRAGHTGIERRDEDNEEEAGPPCRRRTRRPATRAPTSRKSRCASRPARRCRPARRRWSRSRACPPTSTTAPSSVR